MLIQQLLLAGVPERLVVEEDGLFPDVSVDQSTGAVKPVRAHPVDRGGRAAPDAGDEMEAAETAAHRVLERWRARELEGPLLDAEAAAATQRATTATTRGRRRRGSSRRARRWRGRTPTPSRPSRTRTWRG